VSRNLPQAQFGFSPKGSRFGTLVSGLLGNVPAFFRKEKSRQTTELRKAERSLVDDVREQILLLKEKGLSIPVYTL